MAVIGQAATPLGEADLALRDGAVNDALEKDSTGIQGLIYLDITSSYAIPSLLSYQKEKNI